MSEIIHLLTRHGPVVVFVVAFLEQIGAPVPAIPVLIVAAAITSAEGGSLWMIGLLIVAGAMIADLIWFALGRLYGYSVLAFLCRISLSPDSCVRKTESFYSKYGLPALVVSKFIPGFSLVAPPLAGALPRMRFLTFLVFDSLGAALWAGVSIAIGVAFRGQIGSVLDRLAEHGRVAGAVLIALVVLLMLWKWWERRRFYEELRMARISPRQLREMIDAEEAVIILDARSAIEQRMDPACIPGAIMLSADDLDEQLAGIALHEEVVLYCT